MQQQGADAAQQLNQPKTVKPPKPPRALHAFGRTLRPAARPGNSDTEGGNSDAQSLTTQSQNGLEGNSCNLDSIIRANARRYCTISYSFLLQKMHKSQFFLPGNKSFLLCNAESVLCRAMEAAQKRLVVEAAQQSAAMAAADHAEHRERSRRRMTHRSRRIGPPGVTSTSVHLCAFSLSVLISGATVSLSHALCMPNMHACTQLYGKRVPCRQDLCVGILSIVLLIMLCESTNFFCDSWMFCILPGPLYTC